MRAGRELRRIVIARIIDQVPELSGRVYDRAVKATEYPYATLGPSYWLDTSVQCIEARVQTLQIDVWTDDSKALCEDLTDDISAALKGWTDTDVLTMPPLRVSLARVMDDPGGAFHGVVQIEAAVEG